jgi:hypothetical protein
MSPVSASHDVLRLALIEAGQQVAGTTGDGDGFPAARDSITRFCYAELLPHLEADERWLLGAQDTESRLVAEAMRSEARAMTAAVYELADATDACRAVAAIRVLHALLAAHAHHEQLLVAAGCPGMMGPCDSPSVS